MAPQPAHWYRRFDVGLFSNPHSVCHRKEYEEAVSMIPKPRRAAVARKISMKEPTAAHCLYFCDMSRSIGSPFLSALGHFFQELFLDDKMNRPVKPGDGAIRASLAGCSICFPTAAHEFRICGNLRDYVGPRDRCHNHNLQRCGFSVVTTLP